MKRKNLIAGVFVLSTLLNTTVFAGEPNSNFEGSNGLEIIKLNNGETIEIITQESVREKVKNDLIEDGYSIQDVEEIYGGAYIEDGDVVLNFATDDVKPYNEKIKNKKIKNKELKVKKVKYSEDELYDVYDEICDNIKAY